MMNSDCERMKDQIADLVTGILSEAHVQEVEQHVKECAACWDYARALKNEDALLTEFVADVNTDMTSRQERLLQVIDRSYRPRQTENLSIRRRIMKSSITRIAAAAVIIAAVLIAASQFGSPVTGVAWGEVIRRMEASRGLICRRIMTLSNRPGEEDYRMIYCCPTHTRTDQYEADRITWSRYCDYSARTMVRIEHDKKRYFRHTISEQEAQEHRDEISPKVWAQKFLSAECRKLGQKMIDGIVCEGLETTDQAVVGESDPPVDSAVLRLWVSVETGYPLLFEGNAARQADDGGRIKVVLDQFQWDVELDPSIFEPNIPPDYVSTRDL